MGAASDLTMLQMQRLSMRPGMLVPMTRLTITVPDALAEQVRAAAGENVSAWVAQAVRDRVLREECAALAEWEQANRDEDWDNERWAA
jgi:hypothetical protein